MNKSETIQVLAILKAAYPQFYKDMHPKEYESVINLWTAMFAGDEPRTVAMAVKAHIATDDKGFPPVIGQIKKRITQITQPETLSEMEAWALVRKAVANSNYNSKAEFDNLPPAVQRVVGSHNMLKEWAMIDNDTFQTVTQSNFMRSFKAVQASEKETKALPADVKNYIADIASGFNLNKALDAPTGGMKDDECKRIC